MFCKNCGSDLLDTVKFCPNCGSKIEVEEPSEAVIVDSTPENNTVEVITETTNSPETESEVVEVIPVTGEEKFESPVTYDVAEPVEVSNPVEVSAPVVETSPVAPDENTVETLTATPVEASVEDIPTTDTYSAPESVAATTAASTIATAVANDAFVSNKQEAPMAENTTTTTTTTTEVKPSRKAIRDKKNYEKNAKKQAVIDSLPAEYKPVSVSTYFWLTVLAVLPCIGFIFSIILSFTGRNKNRKNFMKAIFVWYIIGIILTLVAALVLTFAFPDAMGVIIDGIADLLIDLGLA